MKRGYHIVKNPMKYANDVCLELETSYHKNNFELHLT